MSLFVTGDRKKIEKLYETAKELKLFIVHHSDDPNIGVTFTAPYKQLEILAKLPPRLIKTYVILLLPPKKWYTAEDMSKLTKRKRSVESGYLNQLVLHDVVIKERRGREAYFKINEEKTLK